MSLEQYTEGVWYDSEAGEYCQVELTEEDNVALTPPHESTIYHEWQDHLDALTELDTHFRQVSEEAVENPESVVADALRVYSRNDPNELMSLSLQDSIDLSYARDRVEIVES